MCEPSSNVPEIFHARVCTTPGGVAVVCGKTEITYAELNSRAEALAARLQSEGVKAETRVGIFLDRSLDLIVAILGVLKAGGAYVAIDTAYPPERIAFILEDAQAPLLITHREHALALPATTRPFHLDAAPRAGPAPLRPPQITPESAAYVVYTSGSTGKPKGVVVTHHNVVRLFRSTEHWFGFGSEDVWTLFHSCAFDFSVWEIWGALFYGGKLVVVPRLTARSPEQFYELLVRERVTVLNQTPAAFRQIVAVDGERRSPLALRYVIFGGEALDFRSLKPWFDRRGDRQPQLVNMYGISETTVHVTYRPLTLADIDSGSMIGVPIPDLQIHLLDPEQRPVPEGEPGEIYVGGAGLAREYLDRPELTRERFIANPFGEGRLYRTGDRARRLPDGDLEYLGRVDHQLKIRGFRVEPGEIESALCTHPAVREAVVLLREDSPGDKRLVAWLTAGAAAVPPHAELRAFLKTTLPPYMIPSAFVVLDALPLTPHGKIDRRALPSPVPLPAPLAAPAPRSALERQIAGIWTETLRLESVGVNDNFFDIGGDSLSIVTVHQHLRAQIRRELPITDLFQFPTIAALAAHLDRPASPSVSEAQERAARMRQAFGKPRGIVSADKGFRS